MDQKRASRWGVLGCSAADVFINKGVNGRWMSFTPAEVAEYEARAEQELGLVNCARWLATEEGL